MTQVKSYVLEKKIEVWHSNGFGSANFSETLFVFWKHDWSRHRTGFTGLETLRYGTTLPKIC